jgi:hypothetical protein
MARRFSADIRAFRNLTGRRALSATVDAIQDVLEGAQTPQQSVKLTGGSFEVGKIPVDTSELINSLEVGGAVGPDSYVLALAGMELGDYLHFTWTAPHALPMELGYTKTLKDGTQLNVPGRHFVGTNAAKFSEFFARRASEV